MGKQRTKERGQAPLWGWVLVGWLAAGTAVAWALREETPPAEARTAAEQGELEWDLETMNPRELRTLPDIGTKRAVEIADQRWSKKLDDPKTEAVETDIRAIPGIGPKTDHSVRRFIHRRMGPERLYPPGLRAPRVPSRRVRAPDQPSMPF